MKLMEYYPMFVAVLTSQLQDDQKRWGDEWKHRPIEAQPDKREPKKWWAHQNDRIFRRIEEYFIEWDHHQTPIPWPKIAGLAFIAWVRESYPEEYSK